MGAPKNQKLFVESRKKKNPMRSSTIFNRIGIFAVFATAASMSASAQTSKSASENFDWLRDFQRLQDSLARPSVVDLSGEWDADRGDRKFPIRLTVSGGTLSATDLSPDSPNRGRVIFSATYRGEQSFAATIVPWSNPPKTFTITVKDPDTLISPNLTFRRTSPPPLNDFPCDAANSFHVQRAGIWARANAAAEAHDDAKAYCWISVGADAGDTEAQYYKARYLLQGIGTEKNTHAGYLWMFRCASPDFPDAERDLSILYERGIGIPANPERAKFYHDLWQRHLIEKQRQQAEQLTRGIDSVQSALDGLLGGGGELYPGQKCGLSYRASLSSKDKDPCAHIHH
jgi:hypothetical protein